MELYEKGYIPEKDVPFPIRFGDGDTLVKLVQIMGERKGIGALLAEGSYRLAEHYGHPELSMSVKKQEMAAYDPRAIKGIGLNYATSNRGACHVRGYTISQEVIDWPEPVDRLQYEGKAELTKYMQDFTAVIDSSGMCLFTIFGMGYVSDYGPILRAVTGLPYSDDELMKAGERIWNMERLFNLKAGLTGKDDTLPPRLLKEPIPSGPSKGEVCELDRMLPEYYQLRGWDEEGRPTKEKLEELGLKI
jgi:aldehyde:ferredoxin oxidoreductase